MRIRTIHGSPKEVVRVEQVDTLSYGYVNLRIENTLPIQKEVYQVYPLYPEALGGVLRVAVDTGE
jgi:hypothetical protein